MKRCTVILAAIALLAAACGGGGASPTPSTALVDIGQGLQGPAGLSASVYTKGIVNAAAFAFDSDGRLWVSTAAYQDTGSDAVYLVAGPGATPVKVIDGLHTALGLLWYQNELYVSSKERVDAYSGFDGSRFTQTRQVLALPAGVGESNGLIATPEGRIVLGISAPCNACTPQSQYSAAVLSFLPDGGDLRVEASGIRAPIDFAYYPGTSDLFVTMNQRDDLGDATPGDWLAQVQSGQNWRFPDCYGQGGSVCEGVPAPTAVLDPHAAVSGVAIVTGQLGDEVGDAAIVAEWATGKVLMVRLTKTSSGYTGEVAPFLTGIKNPVAVGLTPNGDLLVGDWTSGTIYQIAAN